MHGLVVYCGAGSLCEQGPSRCRINNRAALLAHLCLIRTSPALERQSKTQWAGCFAQRGCQKSTDHHTRFSSNTFSTHFWIWGLPTKVYACTGGSHVRAGGQGSAGLVSSTTSHNTLVASHRSILAAMRMPLGILMHNAQCTKHSGPPHPLPTPTHPPPPPHPHTHRQSKIIKNKKEQNTTAHPNVPPIHGPAADVGGAVAGDAHKDVPLAGPLHHQRPTRVAAARVLPRGCAACGAEAAPPEVGTRALPA